MSRLSRSADRAPVMVASPYAATPAPLSQARAVPARAALLLMPFALALLGAGASAPNPLSLAFHGGAPDPARPGVVAISRHPFLAGLCLWGAAHVPANGDLTRVILFGGAALFAGFGMIILDRHKRRELGADWYRLAAATSAVPFGAILGGRARFPRDVATFGGAAAGLVLYALLLGGGHRWLFGGDPLAGF
ncbi:MAG: NnrU family protein [Alphaproteobacteria bacterium]|nr:NnrU family protein [Alphaproteobacteria bacterium]